MATHIKRDGNIFCLMNSSMSPSIKNTMKKRYNQSCCSWSDALRQKDMKQFCPDCLKVFYQRLNRAKIPTIV